MLFITEILKEITTAQQTFLTSRFCQGSMHFKAILLFCVLARHSTTSTIQLNRRLTTGHRYHLSVGKHRFAPEHLVFIHILNRNLHFFNFLVIAAPGTVKQRR